jgi:hypothetical protein
MLCDTSNVNLKIEAKTPGFVRLIPCCFAHLLIVIYLYSIFSEKLRLNNMPNMLSITGINLLLCEGDTGDEPGIPVGRQGRGPVLPSLLSEIRKSFDSSPWMLSNVQHI